MKRSITILTLIILSAVIHAQSNDFTYTRPDGSWFHCIVISDSTVSVDGVGTDTLNRIIFPETVTNGNNTYTVTEIADSTGVDESRYPIQQYVEISNTITRIGDYAFYLLSGNDSVTIGTGVTYLGDYAFWRMTLYNIRFNAVNCQYFGPDAFNARGGSMGTIDTLFIGDSVESIPPPLLNRGAGLVLIYSSHLHIDTTTFSYLDDLSRPYQIEFRCPPPAAMAHSLDYLIRRGWGVCVPCDMLALYENDSVWNQVSLIPRIPLLTLYHSDNGSAEIVVSPTCDNHQATISATSHIGWHFSEWSDGNTDSFRTLMVDSDMKLRACFEPNIDSTRYFKYYTFEDESDDTIWSRSVTTPCASWWIGTEAKINGNRGLYVGGVRRDDGTAPISIGGGGGYPGGPGSRGTLYAYTSQSFFVPEGMYNYNYDFFKYAKEEYWGGGNLTVALIPDSSAVPLLHGEDYTIPDNAIYFQRGLSGFSDWWAGDNGIWNCIAWVPDSGLYRLLVVYGYSTLALRPGDTIGVVIDDIFFEKQDSVLIVNGDATSNPYGWTEGGGMYAYGDTVTFTAHPNEGCRFVRWFNGDTNRVMQFVAHYHTLVTAVFEPDSFNVTIDITGQNVSVGSLCSHDMFYDIIRCCDSGEYTCHTEPWGWVSVELIPDSGHVFFGWRDGNTDNPRSMRIDFLHDTVLRPIIIPMDSSYRDDYGFENPARDSDWVVVTGNSNNRWVIDTAVHSEGNRALYISNDGGSTNQYDLYSEDNVYAYTTIHLDAATIYEWSYDWRGGRCSIDFVQMALYPDSIEIIGGQGLPNSACFVAPSMCGNSGWSSTSGYFHTIDSGDYKLVFQWRTLGWDTGVSDMAGAIDNVSIRSVGPLQWVFIEAGGRNGRVAGRGYHQIGDTVTLVAIPREHFHFVQWEDGDTNRLRHIVVSVMSEGVSYTAQFEPDTFMVSTVRSGESFYGISGAGVYRVDGYWGSLPTATITVTPAYGYAFVRWTDGNTDNPRLLVIDRDTLLQPVVVLVDTSVIRQNIVSESFEMAAQDSLWTLVNGGQINTWYIGSASHSEGNQGLYISNDGGLSNNYTHYGCPSNVYAYRILHLLAGKYEYNYDWRCNGTEGYDYMRVMLYDTTLFFNAGWTLPNGGISIDGGNQLSGRSDWQTVMDTLTIAQENDYLLTFYWTNDYSSGTNPAAAIDNIGIARLVPLEECDYVPPVFAEYDSICAGESVSFHGTTYSESGSYIYHSNYHTYNDTIFILHLAVGNSNNIFETVSACDSYTWHDTTYTTSTNTPTYSTTNAYGCDSTVTLHLTIHYNNYGIDDVTTCDSYTWIDSITYSVSTNEPTVTISNVYGCDSTVTLHLTIHYSSYDTIVDSATCSYIWQGNTYTESGEYVFETQTESGCDSIIVLQLFITHAGITDFDNLDGITLYPNPTLGKVIIGADKVDKVEVFDHGGRIAEMFLDTNEIDISHLPTGAYTLRITLKNGCAIKRIIKQ